MLNLQTQHMKIELDAELEEEGDQLTDIAFTKMELGRVLKDPDLIDDVLLRF